MTSMMSHRHRDNIMCLLGIWSPLGPHNILNLGPPKYSKPSYAFVVLLS